MDGSEYARLVGSWERNENLENVRQGVPGTLFITELLNSISLKPSLVYILGFY